MTAFAAIAWYNTLEILILSAFVFKKHSGLYFWSVIVCALSIAVYSTGKCYNRRMQMSFWDPRNVESY